MGPFLIEPEAVWGFDLNHSVASLDQVHSSVWLRRTPPAQTPFLLL